MYNAVSKLGFKQGCEGECESGGGGGGMHVAGQQRRSPLLPTAFFQTGGCISCAVVKDNQNRFVFYSTLGVLQHM